MAGRAPRLSGLQKQVLSLYRSALRLSRAKEQQGGEAIAVLARAEIERYRSVSRKDYQLIEHLIRKGKRQLERLQSPEVTGVRLHHPGQ
ncbi:hypothetical protein CHLNCDRAFT_134067 [Chlorella variabilis]|uniref:Complex 1 LYR protein domain-containing protein n=1 Tax=Chlorella variabilis TaxID=554065 RepID=E1ZEX5_CHLVA|nr:hypothetical protein CHLNCDRAFT_134067 [Chlorella variabilis]EFN55735.1 hypothetical protein CHLNCDRAFT_134067 [Chlorella variabilis]|eukprot:XP_005847837.1 hypothetical protein CHLNCDRAFT_134067 [Chlorella variabilis]